MITDTQSSKAVFSSFNPRSKIWIYSSNRFLETFEETAILSKIKDFTKVWTAHDQALKADGIILHKRFIVLAVDESQTLASGCSIDKSVHFIQGLEREFDLQLFDRLTIYYKKGSELSSFHFSEIDQMVSQGVLNSETEIYDTTLTSLEGFQNRFCKKATESWLAKYLT